MTCAGTIKSRLQAVLQGLLSYKASQRPQQELQIVSCTCFQMKLFVQMTRSQDSASIEFSFIGSRFRHPPCSVPMTLDLIFLVNLPIMTIACRPCQMLTVLSVYYGPRLTLRCSNDSCIFKIMLLRWVLAMAGHAARSFRCRHGLP